MELCGLLRLLHFTNFTLVLQITCQTLLEQLSFTKKYEIDLNFTL
jgi:hypothetical protein